MLTGVSTHPAICLDGGGKERGLTDGFRAAQAQVAAARQTVLGASSDTKIDHRIVSFFGFFF